MAKPNPPPPSLAPIRDATHRKAIMTAISGYDLAKSSAWKDLTALSKKPEVDTIQANSEGIFTAGDDRFEATGTIYVKLLHNKKSPVSTDSFPVHVTGKLVDGNRAQIEHFSVDTSSFFGDPGIVIVGPRPIRVTAKRIKSR